MIKIKTNKNIIYWPLLQVERYACPELSYHIEVLTNSSYYVCERSSQTYCYGTGWCPLRFKDSWTTPKLSKDGSHWRKY